MKRTAFLATLALIPLCASAQVFNADDNSARMSLGNDTYIAGNLLNITEAVSGDLLAAGNRIAVKGDVTGDLQAAGSNVTIDGNVGDDVRAAGGDLTINGNVAGDVIVFGGTVYVSSSSTIEGNLLVSGGSIVLEGNVRGNMKTSGGDLTVRGTVAGTSDIRGDKVTVAGAMSGNAVISARELTVNPEATFGADVRYWTGSGEADIGNQVTGKASFDAALAMRDKEAAKNTGAFGAILASLTIFALFSAALAMLIFQLATRTFFIDSAKRLHRSPLLSMLWGLIYFLMMPSVVILFMFTVVGIPIALTLAAIYIITIVFSQVLSAMVFARLAELRAGRKWHPAAVYFAGLGFWVLLKLLWLIPFIGWIAVFLAIIAGYGALLMAKKDRYWKVA